MLGGGGGFTMIQGGFAVLMGTSLSLDLLLGFLVCFMALDVKTGGRNGPLVSQSSSFCWEINK